MGGLLLPVSEILKKEKSKAEIFKFPAQDTNREPKKSSMAVLKESVFLRAEG